MTIPPSGEQSILSRLKTETRSEHAAIESVLDLMSDGLTRDHYSHVLERFYGFYMPIERAILSFGGWTERGLDLDSRQKCPLLEADLRALELDGPVPRTLVAERREPSGEERASPVQPDGSRRTASYASGNLPLCDDLPRLDTLAECFGCLYVLEGSTLGGQFIIRHVQQVLGVTVETGGRFFQGYGDKTGEMWHDFRSVMTRVVVASTDQDAAVTAAKETFQKLHRWFSIGRQNI